MLNLENESQILQLVPALGGGIAGWFWKAAGADPLALLRSWDQQTHDPAALAGFALLPWSNRITQGGFAHQGVHHALQENRAGEAYPLHGDGWQQAWSVRSQSEREVILELQSRRHNGNPHEYDAEQRFILLEDGLRIRLKATHRGRTSMLYGLGMHLCFPIDAGSRLQAAANGVWLSGPDPIPVAHSSSFPPGWNFRLPQALAPEHAIDNCYTGWDGVMRLSQPLQHLMLSLSMKENSGYFILAHPKAAQHFCFEPVTHPIDAFHAKSRPGLVSLCAGESVAMELDLRVEKLEAGE